MAQRVNIDKELLYQKYVIENKSILLIEEYGKLNNLSFKHAENGGEYYISELGYWVDGYDEKNNIVLEYDENYHNKQVEKDNKRQKEIIDYLKCGFIRLNENGDEIFKLNSNE